MLTRVRRFFVLLSGLAHVTLPEGDGELWIEQGADALMIAADIVGDGHYTEYPSEKESVALQIPFLGGLTPNHRVVREGICNDGSGHSEIQNMNAEL
jgi:hypothetical protein